MSRFTPKPGAPGDRVFWTHTYPSGSRTERSGIVWDRGPLISGKGTLWVVPDQRFPSDVNPVVLIARVPTRGRVVIGLGVHGPEHEYLTPGTWYCSNTAASPTGALMFDAATATRKIRETNANIARGAATCEACGLPLTRTPDAFGERIATMGESPAYCRSSSTQHHYPVFENEAA